MRLAQLFLILTTFTSSTLALASPASGQEPAPTDDGADVDPDGVRQGIPDDPTTAPDPQPDRPKRRRHAPRRPPPEYPPGYGPPPGYGYGQQGAPPPSYDYRYTDPDVYRGTRGARIGLATGGAVLMGLGALTMLASGISWLVAWGESRDLDEECPNHQCMEQTDGGDSLESSRDAADASEVLLAVGAPTFSVGVVMLVVMGTLPRTRVASGGPSPAVGLSAVPGGAALTVRF